VFDFPVPTGYRASPSHGPKIPHPRPVSSGSGQIEGTSRPAASGRRARPVVTPQERRIKITDMITAGRLRPGATLHGDYQGVTHQAELLSDGQVRYGGQNHSSPSAAGRAVKVHVLGVDTPESRISTDGLDFWRATDALSGDVVSIKEIRRRTARDAAASGDSRST